MSRSLPKIRSNVGLIAVLVLGVHASYGAAPVTFTGAGAKDERGVAAFVNPENWSTKSLPGSDANVLIRSVAMLDQKGDHTIASLETQADLYVSGGATLAVAGDVVVKSVLEAQNSSITWTGRMIVGGTSPRAAVTYTHDGRKSLKASGLKGGELTLLPGSTLTFKLFHDVPVDLPGGSVPVVELSGGFTTDAAAKVLVQLSNLASPLPAGDYLLVKASAITGPLPTLEFKMSGEKPAPKGTLRQEDGKLILTIAG